MPTHKSWAEWCVSVIPAIQEAGQTEHKMRPYFKNNQSEKEGGCWWFMPVILATKEAEIRRITV
jgi:hypothetical protein